MEKLILTNTDCALAVERMIESAKPKVITKPISVYGVPRGGIPVAYLVAKDKDFFVIDNTCHGVDWVVDDIVDSGNTRARIIQLHPTAKFLALADYLPMWREFKQWVVFPWEVTDKGTDESATDIVTRLLQFIGEDPNREGLKETPARVLKAWKEWTSGYGQDPKTVLKVFEDGAEGYGEMLIEPDIPFYSFCEHHLAPFFGTVTIGYIPNKRILGLSKFKRLVDIFAKRLQVQERLTTQIADALMEHLGPLGVGVQIKARHLCKESRGIQTVCKPTMTNALRGVMLTSSMARAEFLQACK